MRDTTVSRGKADPERNHKDRRGYHPHDGFMNHCLNIQKSVPQNRRSNDDNVQRHKINTKRRNLPLKNGKECRQAPRKSTPQTDRKQLDLTSLRAVEHLIGFQQPVRRKSETSKQEDDEKRVEYTRLRIKPKRRF